MRRKIDLTGQRFGRLTVIKPAERPEYTTITSSFWICQCDCGNETITNTQALKTGATRSCGCLRQETCAKTARLRWANR